MSGNHPLLIAAKTGLLVFGCLQAQVRSTLDLVGNDVLSIMVPGDSLVVHYPDPFEIPTVITNNSPEVIELSCWEGMVPSSPLVNTEGVLWIEPGFSLGIYDGHDSSQLSVQITMYQPLPPDSVWEDDAALARYYELELARLDSALQVPSPPPNMVRLGPYETVEHGIRVSLSEHDEVAHAMTNYNVEENHDYYLRLFYCREQVLETVSSDTIDCSISNTVKLVVRYKQE